MPDIARWEPHGTGSRMDLGPRITLFTFRQDSQYFAISGMWNCVRQTPFPTQAEAEAFAVATLRGILEDVMGRLPE